MNARRAGIAFAALAVSASVFVLPGALRTPAGAASNLEVGWWWLGQAQAGLAPAPPNVPDGGLWVSSDPSGPHAYSAVRFSLGPDETSPVLTLKVNSEQPDASAQLVACPTKSPWTPAVAGDWNSRPAYDCSVSALGVSSLAENVNSVAFDLSTITVGKIVDVAIVPVSGPPQPPPQVPTVPLSPPAGTVPNTSNAFDITFNAPSTNDITTFQLADDESTDNGNGIPESAFPAPDSSGLVFDPTATTFPSLLAPPVVAQPQPLRRIAVPIAVTPPVKVDSRSAARVLAAAVFFALAAWWYQLTFAGANAADKRARPRITIYDDPHRVLATTGTAHAARTGKAPALR